MMGGSAVMTAVMIAMMAVMMGGMVFAGARTFVRRRKRPRTVKLRLRAH